MEIGDENKKQSLAEVWGKIDFNKFSTWSLIFSNLAVIFFAVIDKLSALDVLWIYWTQSVIIGLFNFVKMLSLKQFSTKGLKQNKREMPATKAVKISTAIFFLFHYGFFHFIYSVFLGAFSSMGFAGNRGVSTEFILLSGIIFLINYGIEFINEKKRLDEETPNLGTIMFAPYARIIPMHLTIILGGFIGTMGSIFSADTNLAVIILLMGIKTFVDLVTHAGDIFKLSKLRT